MDRRNQLPAALRVRGRRDSDRWALLAVLIVGAMSGVALASLLAWALVGACNG